MFDALKNLGSLPGLMSKARELQERIQATQEEIGRRPFTADAGGGRVEATVSGKLELIKLRIDKSKIDVADTEMVEDLIVAAVRAAQNKAAFAMKTELAKISEEIGIPPGMIPGM